MYVYCSLVCVTVCVSVLCLTSTLAVVAGGRFPEPLCGRGVQLRQAGDSESTGPEGTRETAVQHIHRRHTEV